MSDHPDLGDVPPEPPGPADEEVRADSPLPGPDSPPLDPQLQVWSSNAFRYPGVPLGQSQFPMYRLLALATEEADEQAAASPAATPATDASSRPDENEAGADEAAGGEITTGVATATADATATEDAASGRYLDEYDDDSEDDETEYDSQDEDHDPVEMEPIAHPSTWEREIRMFHEYREQRIEAERNAHPPPPRRRRNDADSDDDDYSSEDEEGDYTDEEHVEAARRSDYALHRNNHGVDDSANGAALVESPLAPSQTSYTRPPAGPDRPRSHFAHITGTINPHRRALRAARGVLPGSQLVYRQRGGGEDGAAAEANASATDMPQTDGSSGANQATGSQPAPRPDAAPDGPVVDDAPQQSQAEFAPNVDLPFLPSSPPRLAPATPPPQEVALPRWQPDAEVTLCPICGTQFSFFIRKHHCRKCGRVVCNACSPHRITIPYQFIVQPPNESSPPAPLPQFPPGFLSSPASVTSLGGGERVRLCNPCVPDPNVAPPQPSPGNQQSLRSPQLRAHNRALSLASSRVEAFPRLPVDEVEERIQANRNALYHSPTHRGLTSQYVDRRRQLTPDRRSTVSFAGPRRVSRAESEEATRGSDAASSTSSASRGAGLVPRFHGVDVQQPGAGDEAHDEVQGEFDHCPVCHTRLPTRSIDMETLERLREAHVRECIDATIRGYRLPPPDPAPRLPHFIHPRAGIPSSSLPASSLHPAAASSSSNASGSGSRNIFASRFADARRPVPAAPAVPTLPRRTGIFPYRATEKDGVDSAECTICFEEFEVGVEMARLECFCRFHHACIMRWFENRPGQCPVHQHDGGGY